MTSFFPVNSMIRPVSTGMNHHGLSIFVLHQIFGSKFTDKLSRDQPVFVEQRHSRIVLGLLHFLQLLFKKTKTDRSLATPNFSQMRQLFNLSSCCLLGIILVVIGLPGYFDSVFAVVYYSLARKQKRPNTYPFYLPQKFLSLPTSDPSLRYVPHLKSASLAKIAIFSHKEFPNHLTNRSKSHPAADKARR